MKIYLDNAATTPLRKEVLNEMKKYFLTEYGNASSLHEKGLNAFEAKEKAREKIAKNLGAKKKEIYFTSGGTESDNLALKGIMNKKNKKKLIISAIEHPAVLRTAEFLKKQGKKISIIPVDSNGLIDLNKLKKEIDSNTALVSIMHANNEIGVIQPVKEIAELCKEKNILFHSDTVQTIGKMKLNLNKLGIDLASISAHKFNGPKGIGAIYIKEGTSIETLIHGGGQEKKIRSGTENIPGIIGLNKALELNLKNIEEEQKRQEKLRNELIKFILEIPKTTINGTIEKRKRLSNNVNASFYGIEGEALITLLNEKGIYASTGSACSSNSLKASHVLLSLGLNHVWAHGSLRLTLGKETTKKEINYVKEKLPKIIEKLRKMSSIKISD
jgi:cysteine desulfurase